MTAKESLFGENAKPSYSINWGLPGISGIGNLELSTGLIPNS
jgi:hypothetical protein